MRKSEVFEEFIKISQDKGLISKDAPEKAKKQLEKNPRADSLDISAIEALYGVKPDIPKNMDYKRNIIEDAHPESVVVSPSYDKLNGLVENNNERQNILLHIVNKTPDGLSTHRKYAAQELTMALVRVANDLDNQDKLELMKLADTCLFQVNEQGKKKIHKQAFAWGALAAAVAALIGIVATYENMPDFSRGFKQDHDRLISEINDMLPKETSWLDEILATFGFGGYVYTEDFKKLLMDLKSKITAFYGLYEKFAPLVAHLQKPKTGAELVIQAQQPHTQEVLVAYQTLKNAAKDLVPYLETVMTNCKSTAWKAAQIMRKGAVIDFIDKAQVLHGGNAVVADDFEDIAKAIPPYERSIAELVNFLQQSKSVEDKALEDLHRGQQKIVKLFGPEEEITSDTTTPSRATKDLDQQAEELSASLKGLIPEGLNFV